MRYNIKSKSFNTIIDINDNDINKKDIDAIVVGCCKRIYNDARQCIHEFYNVIMALSFLEGDSEFEEVFNKRILVNEENVDLIIFKEYIPQQLKLVLSYIKIEFLINNDDKSLRLINKSIYCLLKDKNFTYDSFIKYLKDLSLSYFLNLKDDNIEIYKIAEIVS